MRKKLLLLCIGTLFLVEQIRAQWVATDPGDLAQSIINMPDNIVHTSSAAINTVQNFTETVKIYQQYKKYYDALKSVSNLVRDARRVSEIILMAGDVSEIYVTNFQKMSDDENFPPKELDAIAFGYTKLLEESSRVLQDLGQVISVSTLSMTDKDRMDVMDDCYTSMRRYRNLVNYYTNRSIAASFLRARRKNDLDRVLKLYGNDISKYWQLMALLSVDFSNPYTILESLYNEMMLLCEDMLDVARGLAGPGTLFYTAIRVWQSFACAELIDVYPLLCPFAIDIYIMLFLTLVLEAMNTVLNPIVQGTHKVLEGQTMNMQQYHEQKGRLEREAMLRNPETVYPVSDREFDRQSDELG